MYSLRTSWEFFVDIVGYLIKYKQNMSIFIFQIETYIQYHYSIVGSFNSYSLYYPWSIYTMHLVFCVSLQ